MKNKFNFYEVVRIVSNKPELLELNNKLGVITGMSQNESDPSIFCYAVDILNEDKEVIDGWSIYSEDLVTTGKKINPSQLFTSDIIKVEVSKKTGEGRKAGE